MKEATPEGSVVVPVRCASCAASRATQIGRVDALDRLQGVSEDRRVHIATSFASFAHVVAVFWTVLFALFGVVMFREYSVQAGVLLVFTGMCVAIYAAVRAIGASRRTTEGELTEKFITQKRRRHYIVVQGASFRVSPDVYAVLLIGAHYRVVSSGLGAVFVEAADRQRS